MKHRLLTPGPVAVPERIVRAMTQPVVHHRSPGFLTLFEQIRRDLRFAFQTEEEVLVLASSGSGAMEATLVNLFSPRDQVVVVRGGKFGDRWAEMCEAFGIEPICVDVEWGRPVDPTDVRKAFDRNPEARALLVQASETSTGVFHPVRALATLVHEVPKRMIVVDAISAVGVHELRMDEWGIDALISASQKAFALPPGLAFVALSPLAQAAQRRSRSPRYYFDFEKASMAQAENQTPYTPAISLLFGLRETLSLLAEEGLDNRLRWHEIMARAVRSAMRAMGLELLVPESPSFACTAVRLPDGVDGKVLLHGLRDDYGISLAGGQGKLGGKIFRIGHLGDVDGFDMIAAIAAIEMMFADMGYPVKIGEGVRASVELLRELPLIKE